IADREWTYYSAIWPANSDTPGDGRLGLSTWAVITEAVNLLRIFVATEVERVAEHREAYLHLPSWVGELFRRATSRSSDTTAGSGLHASRALDAVHAWCSSFRDATLHEVLEHRHALMWL